MTYFIVQLSDHGFLGRMIGRQLGSVSKSYATRWVDRAEAQDAAERWHGAVVSCEENP